MYPNTNTLFINICKSRENSIQVIQYKVQELKSEYVNDGWKEEFNNLEEAYLEQGRNQAEYDILNELINEYNMHLPILIHHKLFQMLALHYCLEVD